MSRESMIEQIESCSERDLQTIARTMEALERMKDNRYPFLGNFLNVTEEQSEDPDVFVCSMPIGREVHNPYRIVYGGITATLADMAMAWMLELNMKIQDKFVTIDMQMHYHNPGIGKKLIASSRLVNRAQDVWQTACEIRNDRGDLVATANAAFLQLRKPPKEA